MRSYCFIMINDMKHSNRPDFRYKKNPDILSILEKITGIKFELLPNVT